MTTPDRRAIPRRMADPPRPNFDDGGIPVGHHDQMLRRGGDHRDPSHTLEFERLLDYLLDADGRSLARQWTRSYD